LATNSRELAYKP